MKMKLILTLVSCLMPLVVIAEPPLGQLFSSPKERAVLDEERKTQREIVPQAISEPDTNIDATPYTEPNRVTVQGYVKRSDGKSSTVWINDQAIQENSANDEVAIGKLSNKTNRVPIKLKANGKYLSLKAGQVYDPETNQVREMRQAVHGDSGRIGDENSP
jgi:hypothetical protein